MGILAEPAKFVLDLPLPKRYAVCELGDQFITHGERELARDWFFRHGAGRYVSVDGNGRNGAVVHDLNLPLKQITDRFDLVTDFGTGEHVFDQDQVWRTIHYLTRPGGYIAFDRPIAGYPGHCYYLIQPALIHDLAAANLYEIVVVEEADTKRGRLIRGVLRKPLGKRKFVVPQMGRYRKLLRPITQGKES